jgi:hypothetical protein
MPAATFLLASLPSFVIPNSLLNNYLNYGALLSSICLYGGVKSLIYRNTLSAFKLKCLR